MRPHRPNFEDFAKLAQQSPCVPVFRELVADSLTPVSAFAKFHRGGPGFLFESVVGGEKVGRYSVLGTAPELRMEARGTSVLVSSPDGSSPPQTTEEPDPFAVLERLLAPRKSVHLPGLPRIAGGLVGFAGYDSVRFTEHLPSPPPDDRNLPDLAFGLYDRVVAFDNVRKTVIVVVQANVSEAGDARTAYERAAEGVDRIVEDLSGPGPDLRPTDLATGGPLRRPPQSNFTRERYKNVVRRCQEYIRAGDIFQVVPSQRFEVETEADPFAIYRVLRVLNPSPFLFYLPFDDFCLVGCSPEILVRVEDGVVTVRPIAGTRRRGRDEAEDRALAEELLADPKERAEHIMLVDLGRNDVGRVAETGTVGITELMAVERYSHVMHITSNVSGRLAPGKTAFDALRAGLPAGTVSGAPKIRAMEIIDEMEPNRRGPYGGAVGYVDFTGNMDTCIALRTMVFQGGKAYAQAGGGVVYDSVPAAEYEETVNKASVLLKAVEIAEEQGIEGLPPAPPRRADPKPTSKLTGPPKPSKPKSKSKPSRRTH